MKELKELIKISKYVGERFDLVQAGGGNTSTKTDDGKMYVKASGYLLSEMDEKVGYSIVDNNKVISIMNDSKLSTFGSKNDLEAYAKTQVEATLLEGGKPSIETFLHSLMFKYTSHVHSISINAIVSRKDWVEICNKLWPEALLVGYKTPGIELAIEMKTNLDKYVEKNKVKPSVVLMQNHGLIVSSNNFDDIKSLTEKVVREAEDYCNLDFTKYRNTTEITELFAEVMGDDNITSFVEDKVIVDTLTTEADLFLKESFCPDGFVFCGYRAIKLTSLKDKEIIRSYVEQYKDTPKIIMFDNNIYLRAKDVKKAKQIEDVLKSNVIILSNCKDKVNFLERKELDYLNNWESEKYRQNI